MAAACKGVYRNGRPCRSRAHDRGSGYCLTHDPVRTTRRVRRRSHDAMADRAASTARAAAPAQRTGSAAEILIDGEVPVAASLDGESPVAGGHAALVAAGPEAATAALHEMLHRLAQAVRQCHEGSLEPRAGSTMGTLSNAFVRLYEITVLEARITALEQREAAALTGPFAAPFAAEQGDERSGFYAETAEEWG